ncbi:MAG: chemotaxis protein [Ideonella sp.]|nr:chemotaxis protein [Ideonella sp.]
MFMTFKRGRGVAPDAAPMQAPAREPDLHDTVQAMGQQASRIGRDAADVRGMLDDTFKATGLQAGAMAALAEQVQQVTRAQDSIGAQTAQSLHAVARARGAVEAVGSEVAGIVETLHNVAGAAAVITQIALQTRLVAFNASVEAKRAGDAGRAFGVVAEAVKDLAAKVEESSKQIMATVGDLDQRVAGLAREIQPGAAQGQQGAFHRALAEVEGGVARITQAAEQSRGVCAGLDRQMGALEGGMSGTQRVLESAMQRSEAFLKISEQLIELVAESGIATEDTPYIEAARAAAAQVARLFDEALASGSIAEQDLFDEDYRPLPGTEPAQVTTRFVELTDRLLPQVQERVLAGLPRVVFCIAVDRNGYVATHNRKYCQPQRPGELAWNTANSRYRRIFNDRTGLAAARNRRPFLLQTYRRDMGNGEFVLMKEASAPITVNGRHWGGLRLAFQF